MTTAASSVAGPRAARVSRPGLGLAAVAMGFVITLLDTTSVSVALPSIGRGLHVSKADVGWVLIAFNLVFASLLLAGGWFADQFGLRRVFLCGMAGFGVGALCAAMAPSIGFLLAARVIQGLAAALLVPASLSLILHIYDDPGQQSRAMGIWVGVGGASGAVGPLVGGFIVVAFGWRSAFLLGAPAAVVGFVLAWRFIVETERRPSRRVDVWSQSLALASLAMTCTALYQGPRWGWLSSELGLAAALAAVLLVTFVLVDLRSREPMIGFRLLRWRPTGAAAVAMGLHAFGSLGSFIVVIVFLQDQQGLSAATTGLLMMPAGVLAAICAVASGRLTARHGPRRVATVGTALGVVGSLCVICAPLVATVPAVVIGEMILGTAALTTPALTSSALVTAERERTGAVSGLLSVSRQVGALLGIATLSAVAATSAGTAALTVPFVGVAAVFAVACMIVSRALPRRLGR